LEQGAGDDGTGANTAPNAGNGNLTIHSWLTPGILDIRKTRGSAGRNDGRRDAKKKDRDVAILEKVQQGGVKQSGGSHSGSGEPEHKLH
jgi:hypothetical protein